MDNNRKFKEMFQGLIPDGPSILEGKVVKIDPLNIQLINDNKMILGPGVLIIPTYMTDYISKVNIELGEGTISSKTDSHSDTEGEHDHELISFKIVNTKMTVLNSLKKNEKVYLLSFNNGKKYYVLDRVVS